MWGQVDRELGGSAGSDTPERTSQVGYSLLWVPLSCSPFPKACFLADADKEPGSSTSSDTEEDPLPANKCKKVSGSDPAVP